MHFIHSSADINNVANQIIRAGFEYQGQKCSACSRVYSPESFKLQLQNLLINKCSKIKVKAVTDLDAFMTPVISKVAFDRIRSYIEIAKNDPECEILCGGKCDDSLGYFIEPTIVVVNSTSTPIFQEEIFGPVVALYFYKDENFEETLVKASRDSKYALTGSIFAKSRAAIQVANRILRHSSGNFYINDKCTGAVVGQQPFGGGRMSGTNDKAGASLNLVRWTSPRSIKENFLNIESADGFLYPSNK
eukprot:NODE_41_length_34096_cov_2.002235.p17 type:complete len:247 gc:universal NODE_41_length_34096_cov_2.002235:32198-31458(-)